jgi:general secretion pathway protein B
MSYILDALRKSEQQRMRGEAPLLFTTQISSNIEKKPAFLLYSLIALILIFAGILIGWLRPWEQDETETVNHSIGHKQHEEKPPQTSPRPQLLPANPEKDRKTELVLLPAQKSISPMKLTSRADSMGPAPASGEAPPHKSQLITPQPKAAEPIVVEAATPTTEKTTPSSIEPNVTNGSTENTQEPKIIAMTDLPRAIQQEMPVMMISGYAYSNVPKERSVGINDRLLQEGEYLAPGLRLEQITADGLVFSYKKYLFRHNL